MRRVVDLSGVTAVDVTHEPVERFWHGRFLSGSTNLVVGPPKVGKSLAVVAIVADWSRRHGPVILSSAEARPLQRDRLEAATADLRRVRLTNYQLPRDLGQLEQDVREWGARHGDKPCLLALDAASTSFSPYSSQIVKTLTALEALLQDTGATAMLVSQLLKVGPSADALSAIPTALSSAARSIAFLVYDPDDQLSRLCVWVSDQYGEPPSTLALELDEVALVDQSGQLYEVARLFVAEHDLPVLNPLGLLRPPVRDRLQLFDWPLAEAAEWLTDVLAAGPMAVRPNVGFCPDHGHIACESTLCPACGGATTVCGSVQGSAQAEGVSWAALRRAKAAIGVEEDHHLPLGRATSVGSFAYWRLPAEHPALNPYSPRTLA